MITSININYTTSTVSDLTERYFKSKKIYGNFNGGILVENDDLKEFLFHFFRITVCDSGFFHLIGFHE